MAGIARLPTAKKPTYWVGSSREELRAFPASVRKVMGFALMLAQLGEKHPSAKALRGFHGASVQEIVDDHAGNTFRAVYTVQFKGAVYVLHAFQKKSKKGIATPLSDIRLIKERLKQARDHYQETLEAKK